MKIYYYVLFSPYNVSVFSVLWLNFLLAASFCVLIGCWLVAASFSLVQVLGFTWWSNVFFWNVKLMRYQFWCTRCAFRLIKSCQWYSGRKSWNKKNCENCKRAKKQIHCQEIEPNPSKDRAMHEGDNPSF
jgi:hypothetical protein